LSLCLLPPAGVQLLGPDPGPAADRPGRAAAVVPRGAHPARRRAAAGPGALAGDSRPVVHRRGAAEEDREAAPESAARAGGSGSEVNRSGSPGGADDRNAFIKSSLFTRVQPWQSLAAAA